MKNHKLTVNVDDITWSWIGFNDRSSEQASE